MREGGECVGLDSLEFYKRFIFNNLGMLWRNYKYHLICEVLEFVTSEVMEANRPRGVNEA